MTADQGPPPREPGEQPDQSGPAGSGSDRADEPVRPPGHGAIGCFYTALVLGALAWLSLRDRLSSLPPVAIGSHGIFAAAGAGLICGVLGDRLLQAASSASVSLQRCQRRMLGLMAPLNEPQVLLLSTGSAIAEELFFRHAVQDALGPIAAVALYTMLNMGRGFWAWTAVAFVSGVVFSTLVSVGLGLLSATAAHAVVNYLTLRRAVSP